MKTTFLVMYDTTGEPLGATDPSSPGYRLWRLLKIRTNATIEDYHRVFKREAMFDDARYSMDKAKIVAQKYYIDQLKGQTLVLVGDEVWRAFGLELAREILPYDVDGVTCRCLPHPTARSTWYNDVMWSEAVALLLEELYVRGQNDDEPLEP